MLFGLEHYLAAGSDSGFRDMACSTSSPEKSSCTDASDVDSDPIEDVTADDIICYGTCASGEKTLKSGQNGLMSLLSGNQSMKAKPATRAKRNTGADEKKALQKDSVVSALTDQKLASTIDISDVAETSFDASEFGKSTEKAKAIEELERKMFSTGKSVSLRDFLKQKSDGPTTQVRNEGNAPVPENIPIIDLSDDLIIIDERPATESLEKLFPAAKSVSARNLFDSFAPKPFKKANGEWCLKVRLKVSPEKLAAIHLREIPPQKSGQTGTGESLLSTLMRKRPTMKVTFKLPAVALQRVSKSTDPFFTKSSGNQDGKPASNVFAMMMKSASLPKLTAIQKLKGLLPPDVSRELMHVTAEREGYQQRPEAISLKRLKSRTRLLSDLSVSFATEVFAGEESVFLDASPKLARLRYEVSTNKSRKELVLANAPLAFSSLPHKYIYSRFIKDGDSHATHLNWPQKFQPTRINTLLIEKSARHFLEEWITNAFAVLKTQSTKTPRNVKMKELQKKQKKREAMMQNFIVDDFYETDESSTDEDVFVPILIIEGETGSCKSASVYAAMAAMDGYVHEINTGQARSRKDIHSSLKEFCTTNIIHQNHDEKKFQKGLVLFEDCDVLFEQDKTFWTTVQEAINYSRRPIVVTVKDISAVPRNILDIAEEQNSILNLKTPSKDVIKQYLWLCAFSKRLDLSSEVLDSILVDCRTDTGFDLRKALMNCQWLCRIDSPSSEIYKVSYEDEPEPTFEPTQDLNSVLQKLDAVSASDIIETNTHSSILHEVQINELVDIYVIDDSMHLKQKTLPHELNTGHTIRTLFEQKHDLVAPAPVTYNRIRNIILDFLASRAKKVPKFIQDIMGTRVQTRSRSSGSYEEERPETQGLLEVSVCYSMSPQSFLLDLAPIARYWAAFQKKIFAIDEQQEERQNYKNLRDFLGWRKFYNDVDEVIATGFSK